MSKARKILESLNKFTRKPVTKIVESKMGDLTTDLTETGWYVFDTKGEVVQGPLKSKDEVDSKYLDSDKFMVTEVTKDDLPECDMSKSGMREESNTFDSLAAWNSEATKRNLKVKVTNGSEKDSNRTFVALDGSKEVGSFDETESEGYLDNSVSEGFVPDTVKLDDYKNLSHDDVALKLLRFSRAHYPGIASSIVVKADADGMYTVSKDNKEKVLCMLDEENESLVCLDNSDESKKKKKKKVSESLAKRLLTQSRKD